MVFEKDTLELIQLRKDTARLKEEVDELHKDNKRLTTLFNRACDELTKPEEYRIHLPEGATSEDFIRYFNEDTYYPDLYKDIDRFRLVLKHYSGNKLEESPIQTEIQVSTYLLGDVYDRAKLSAQEACLTKMLDFIHQNKKYPPYVLDKFTGMKIPSTEIDRNAPPERYQDIYDEKS